MSMLHRGLAALAVGSLALTLVGPAFADDTGSDDPPVEDPTAEEEVVEEESEQPDDERRTLDVMLANVEEAAAQAGADAEAILAELVTAAVPDGDGGLEEITATFREILERLAGGSTLVEDEEGDGGDDADDPAAGATGFAGTPRTNVGNLLHVASNLRLGAITVIGATADPTTVPLPDPEDARPYSVVESEWTPDTPVVPVVNPLLLAGAVADVPVEDPLNLPLLLATHWGGRLTSVQGGGWNLIGMHSAGSHTIGTNLDTTVRPEGDEATFPFYAPVLDEGSLAVADDAIDFLGFANVTNTVTCTRTVVPVTAFGRVVAQTVVPMCVGIGVILGDGVSFFDGEGPFDLREQVGPLFEPAPEELAPVMAAVDEALASIPVGDVLDAVGEATGALPEVPGDEETPADDPTDHPDGEPAPDDDAVGESGPIDGLLGRLLPTG